MQAKRQHSNAVRIRVTSHSLLERVVSTPSIHGVDFKLEGNRQLSGFEPSYVLELAVQAGLSISTQIVAQALYDLIKDHREHVQALSVNGESTEVKKENIEEALERGGEGQ